MAREVNDRLNVIICGGASQPAIDELSKYIDAQTSIATIGVDAGCLELIKHGYKIDYAVGDFDSVTEDEFQLIKEHSSDLIKHPAQKDDTDMELAIEVAIENYPQADYYIVGAIGETKGRLDHMLANIWMVYQPRFQAIVDRMQFIERNHVFQFFTEGRHQLRVKDAMPDYLSIISMTAVDGLKIEGAVYELAETNFTYPRALISNEFVNEEQEIHISFNKGIVLVLWVNERY